MQDKADDIMGESRCGYHPISLDTNAIKEVCRTRFERNDWYLEELLLNKVSSSSASNIIIVWAQPKMYITDQNVNELLIVHVCNL